METSKRQEPLRAWGEHSFTRSTMSWANLRITETRLVLKIGGELDIASRDDLVGMLSDLASQAADQDDDVEIIIDLSEVTFIDCSAYGVLASGLKAMRHQAFDPLVVPSPPVARLARLLDDDLLEVGTDTEDVAPPNGQPT